MFFGSSDTAERPALSVADIARAKAVCSSCPVFRICLTSALDSPREEYGIWAGTSGRTRRRIWEAMDRGEVTLEQVLDDFCAGDTERYEHRALSETSRHDTVAPLLIAMRDVVSA